MRLNKVLGSVLETTRALQVGVTADCCGGGEMSHKRQRDRSFCPFASLVSRVAICPCRTMGAAAGHVVPSEIKAPSPRSRAQPFWRSPAVLEARRGGRQALRLRWTQTKPGFCSSDRAWAGGGGRQGPHPLSLLALALMGRSLRASHILVLSSSSLGATNHKQRS